MKNSTPIMKRFKILLMLFIAGMLVSNNAIAQVTFSHGSMAFSSNEARDFGDYDNDGDIDLLYTVFSATPLNIIPNNGSGLVSGSATPLNYNHGSNISPQQVGFEFIDDDDTLDVYFVYSGNIYFLIFENNEYVLKAQTYIDSYYSKSFKLTDLNSDGYKDIVYFQYSEIYYRTFNGESFSGNERLFYLSNANMQTSNTSLLVEDLNNDGMEDYVIYGPNYNYSYSRNEMTIMIFENNGSSLNLIKTDIIDENRTSGETKMEFLDMDNDGDKDILIGEKWISSYDGKLLLYTNTDGVFEQSQVFPSGVFESNALHGGFVTADFDNDGDLDIVTGMMDATSYIPVLLLNSSGNFSYFETSFTAQTSIDYNRNNYYQFLYTFDANSDGNPDVFIADGSNISLCFSTPTIANIAPSEPTNLQSTVNGSDVSLSWDASTDDNNGGLNPDQVSLITYNVYLGTSTGTYDILSYSVGRDGNVGSNTELQVSLTPGTYYWTVQAIDINKDTSTVASEQTFTISGPEFNITNIQFDGSNITDLAWGDFNRDGKMDFLSTEDGKMKFFRNDGADTFVKIDTLDTYSNIWHADWIDYDNDNDIDIFVKYGENNKLFTNGQTELSLANVNLSYRSGWGQWNYEWLHYDNDGTYDLMFTSGSSLTVYTDINSSTANQESYSHWQQADLGNAGSLSVEDYDNDGELDILIGGLRWNTSSYLYDIPFLGMFNINEGNSNLKFMDDYDFGDAYFGKWVDIDDDGDFDLITISSTKTKIYWNTGGNLTDSGIELKGLDDYQRTTSGFKVHLIDVDNDGDKDLMYSSNDVLYCYTNESNTEFIPFQLPVNGLKFVRTADYDLDGDVDLLVASNSKITILENTEDPVVNPLEVPFLSSVSVKGSKVRFIFTSNNDNVDYNVRLGTRDNNFDILTPMSDTLAANRLLIPQKGNLKGKNSIELFVKAGVRIYYSAQAIDGTYRTSEFSDLKSVVVPGPVFAERLFNDSLVLLRSVKTGDFNNDNKMDILTYQESIDENNTNQYGNYAHKYDLKLYQNNGDYNFSNNNTVDKVDQDNIQFAYWTDYDSDNDLDVFVKAGKNYLYENSGGVLIENEDYIASDTWSWDYGDEEVEYGDYDNDGDLDMLFKRNNRIVLMRNVDNNEYKEVQFDFTQLEIDDEYVYINIWESNGKFCDFDNDGDFDILVSGRGDYWTSNNNNEQIEFINLMRNDGNGKFEKVDAGFNEDYRIKKIEWVDVDNDGDQDLFLGLEQEYYYYYSDLDRSYLLYRNNGDETFTETTLQFEGLEFLYNVQWVDIENDGDIDAIVEGKFDWITETYYDSKISIFANDGSGNFYPVVTNVDDVNDKIDIENFAFADFDGDNDIDLIVSGRKRYSNDERYQYLTTVYENKISAGAGLGAPRNLSSSNDGYLLNFSWEAPSNAGGKTLTYNLRVGTTTGGDDILSAHVNSDNSLIKPKNGNVLYSNSFTLKTLNLEDTYYWSVQAVDASYNTSPFATDQMLETDPVFEEVLGNNLIAVKDATAAWGDFDNDGDLDLAISGASSSGRKSYLYRNDAGAFVNTNMLLEPMSDGDLEWGDYDNDGDLDLIITGKNAANEAFTNLYENENNVLVKVEDHGIIEVFNSAVSWGDFDDDGDLDLVIAGYNIDEKAAVLRIYKNIDGKFVLENYNQYNNWFLEGFEEGEIQWADMDNDGDLDLVFAGANNSGYPITRIIYNTKVPNNSNDWYWQTDFTDIWPALMNSTFDLGDYDNDGDLDMLISGEKENGLPATYIWKNQNVRKYAYWDYYQTAEIDSMYNGNVSWVDYDNDGDLDILTTGERWDATVVTKLYNNEGNDNFTEAEIDLPGVKEGFVAWGDVERDGDMDLIFTGLTDQGYTSKFVKANMKNAKNTQPMPPTVLNADFNNVGKVVLTWDGASDNETDELALSYNLRLGMTPGGNELTVNHVSADDKKLIPSHGNAKGKKWLLNLKPGTYYWAVQTIDGNYESSDFSDEQTFTLTNEWYEVNMRGIINRTIPGQDESEIKWADFDNDGDLDLAMVGETNASIWQNDNFYFTNIWSGQKMAQGDLDWGDFDNDGDLDLALCGDVANKNPQTIVLINYLEQADEFTPLFFDNFLEYNFTGVYNGTIKWVDYDNDGDLDLAMSGTDETNQGILKIFNFEKDEFGSFSISEIESSLPSLDNSAFTWGDFDNDDDLDIAVMGYDGSQGLIAKIYENNEDVFTPIDATIEGAENGTLEFADYDNDGDLDLFISGQGEFSNVTSLLQNNGGSGFLNIENNFTAVNQSDAAWGDFDSDGYLDLVYSGRATGSGGITKIYQNDAGTFNDLAFDLSDFNIASVNWGDYDADSDLDLVITGPATSGEGNILRVYENVIEFDDVAEEGAPVKATMARPRNKPPTVPTGLDARAVKSTQEATTILFTWEASSDENTLQPGLTYALRIGTTPGGSEIMSVNANTDGSRKVPGKGNTEHNLSWKVDLEEGTYYWAVQAIDAGFEGSDFSNEEALIVEAGGLGNNQAPTDIELSSIEVGELQPVGTVVGSLSTTDPNDGDTHTYYLVEGDGDDDNGSFDISETNLITNEVFDRNQKDTYSVRVQVKDQYNLQYEEIFTISVIEASGIEEITMNSNISVMPNPVRDVAHVKVDDESFMPVSYSVNDMAGTLVQSKQVSSNTFTFERNELASGVYVLEIFNEEGESIKTKLVIR